MLRHLARVKAFDDQAEGFRALTALSKNHHENWLVSQCLMMLYVIVKMISIVVTLFQA